MLSWGKAEAAPPATKSVTIVENRIILRTAGVGDTVGWYWRGFAMRWGF
jgi:hypothetical protein